MSPNINEGKSKTRNPSKQIGIFSFNPFHPFFLWRRHKLLTTHKKHKTKNENISRKHAKAKTNVWKHKQRLWGIVAPGYIQPFVLQGDGRKSRRFGI